MAEETQEQSGGNSFRNVIIGFASTITLGVGTWVTTKITGGDKEEDKPAVTQPAIIINNSQQQQAAQGKTVVVKEKTVEKPAAPAKPKKEGDEFKEKPAQW